MDRFDRQIRAIFGTKSQHWVRRTHFHTAKVEPSLILCASHGSQEEQVAQQVPRVGGYVKSLILIYDFNITVYTRDLLGYFSLLKDILWIMT